MNQNDSFHDRLRQVESLIGELQGTADPAVCDLVRQLTRTLLEMHQKGLERLWQHVENSGAAGMAIRDTLLTDPLVANLLVLHNLHPTDLADRLTAGIAQAQDFVQAQSGTLQVASIADNAVRLQLTPSCSACNSSSAEILQERVEELILAVAPDAVEIAVEVVSTPMNSPLTSGMQLPIVEKPQTVKPLPS